MPDKQVAYFCTGRHPDAKPYTWIRSAIAASDGWAAAEGVTDELLGPMLNCIGPDDDLLEYGIIEYRFSQRFPDLFRTHVAERGHVMLAPARTTASAVRFGMALSRLGRTGDLEYEYGPATGAWSYNSRISYWCRPAKTGRRMRSGAGLLHLDRASCRLDGRGPCRRGRRGTGSLTGRQSDRGPPPHRRAWEDASGEIAAEGC